MPSSDVAQTPAAVIAERVEIARQRKISDQQWTVLNYFRRNNWEAHALDLRQLKMCNERARISELRNDFGVLIEPKPPRPPPGVAALHWVLPESRPRAEYLLQHLSLEGFSETPVQGDLFHA